MEENLVLGLKLLVVGMLTVCLILYIVILLGKGLIAFSNRFPEKKEEPKKEEVIKAVVPEEALPKFKPVGKIDLESLNKRPAAPKVEEPVKEAEPEVAQEPVVVEKPVVEEKKPEVVQVVVEKPVEEKVEPQEVPMEKETSEKVNIQEEDGVFKIRPTEFKSGINVLGKIDLDALNQSTRPKKKSKEEKRKERDEKEKLRQQQRQQMKDAIIKEIRKTDDKNKDGDEEGGKKKKRNRIGKERVDINAPGNQGGGQRKENKDSHPGKNGKDQPELVLKTNLEAAEEIARQMRLRNIGGLVVLDLIDMKSRKHQKQVYRALKDALKRDRARTNVLEISELGLLEMSRQRQDQSILSMLTSRCPYCQGHGVVKSPMAISIEVQRHLTSLLRKAAADKKPFEPKIVIAPQVMQRLRTDDSEILSQLQKDFDTRLTFVSELHRHPESFSILDAATSQVLYSQS